MAAGPAGSAERACAAAMGEHLSAAADVKVVVETTPGGVENLRRLREGNVQLAIAGADNLGEAVNGQGIFQGATVSARTIAPLFDSVLHLVVPADSSIDSLSDLRGRVVAAGDPDGNTALAAERVLQTAHVAPRTRAALDLSEAAAALRSKSVDAMFWLGGAPVPAFEALAAGGFPLKVVSTASVLPLLEQRYGRIYIRTDSPPGEYGQSAPAATLGVATMLVVASGMSDADAYRLTRALFGPSAEGSGPLVSRCGLAVPRTDVPPPAAYHPGALRYFRERRGR